MTTFGNYIKEEREKKGWTQTEFGAKIGINSSAISRIEKGTKLLAPAKLLIVSELFNVKIDIVKELYYGDKFAKEAFKSGCANSVFTTSEKVLLYLRNRNLNQGMLTF